MGLQSQLLGAHAAGIRNVLAITGDPPHVGDYPGSSGVYEVDAIGLTEMLSRLNHGEDFSGKAIDFHTAVSLLDARTKKAESRVVPCRVHFPTLDERRIEDYLRREQPYDCSASAKAEGLGIALIARIETDDPSSLIGLPLIALTELLERAGLPVI